MVFQNENEIKEYALRVIQEMIQRYEGECNLEEFFKEFREKFTSQHFWYNQDNLNFEEDDEIGIIVEHLLPTELWKQFLQIRFEKGSYSFQGDDSGGGFVHMAVNIKGWTLQDPTFEDVLNGYAQHCSSIFDELSGPSLLEKEDLTYRLFSASEVGGDLPAC